MAIKCIKEAKYREGDNLIVRTNWEIIGWAYG